MRKPLKPLTQAQANLLERIADHTRSVHNRYQIYYWLLQRDQQKMLVRLREFGFVDIDRDNQNWFLITEKGWDYIVARGGERPKEYRARRRRARKEMREGKEKARQADLERAASTLDDFFAEHRNG